MHCSTVPFQICPQIACRSGCIITLVAFVWLLSCVHAKSYGLHMFDFSPLCVFKCVLNGLPDWMHNHIGCICLTFLRCEFSNVFSTWGISPTNFISFPHNFASFPHNFASFPQQFASYPQQIASFPQTNSHFPNIFFLERNSSSGGISVECFRSQSALSLVQQILQLLKQCLIKPTSQPCITLHQNTLHLKA